MRDQYEIEPLWQSLLGAAALFLAVLGWGALLYGLAGHI